MSEWIYVTESLPDLDEPVFVIFDENGWIHCGARIDTGEGWLWCLKQGFGSVINDIDDYEADDDYSPIAWRKMIEFPEQIKGNSDE